MATPYSLSSWAQVSSDLKASRVEDRSTGGGVGEGARLVVVAFIHTWNPAAVHTAALFHKLTEANELPFAALHVLDADVELSKAKEYK